MNHHPSNLPQILIVCDVELLHTDSHPRCDDAACPCNEEEVPIPADSCPCGSCAFVRQVIERVDQQLDYLHDDVENMRTADQDRNVTQQCGDGSWW